MKTYIPYSLLAAIAATGLAVGAETAYTTPVGYVTQTCLSASDTVVGLPLRSPVVAAAALSAAADTSVAGSATLTFSGTPGFVASAFAGTHYVKIKSGASIGRWYEISANTTSSITVTLNGAPISVAAADTVEIVKFWTLAELFNPATATTDPSTTPHAIVASTSTLASGRRSEVLIPDLTSIGSNLAPSKNFYIHSGIWKQSGQGATSFNTFRLWPDTHFIIRNPAAVTASTKYTVAGEVDALPITVNLITNTTVKQDNSVALTRPVNITLNQLGLGGTSAFVTSTSSLSSGRRDEVLVYDNAVSGLNKAPSANYYYYNSAWRKSGSPVTTDFGSDVIPAGSGIIVRKYSVAGGVTATWNNTASY